MVDHDADQLCVVCVLSRQANYRQPEIVDASNHVKESIQIDGFVDVGVRVE